MKITAFGRPGNDLELQSLVPNLNMRAPAPTRHLLIVRFLFMVRREISLFYERLLPGLVWVGFLLRAFPPQVGQND